MLKAYKIVLIFLVFTQQVVAQQVFGTIDHTVFKDDEELKYEFKYGFLTTAGATLKIYPTKRTFDSNPVFHLKATGETRGIFDIFYSVSNVYESFIDQKTFLPYLHIENIKEGSYKRDREVKFFQNQKKVECEKVTYKAGEQTFDLLSVYYFARSLNLQEFKPKDKFVLKYFLDNAIFPLEAVYQGKEIVSTDFGDFHCLKFYLSVRPGKVLKEDSKISLWISDDTNRIPVKAQVEMKVGSLRVELTSAKGFKYPINFVK